MPSGDRIRSILSRLPVGQCDAFVSDVVRVFRYVFTFPARDPLFCHLAACCNFDFSIDRTKFDIYRFSGPNCNEKHLLFCSMGSFEYGLAQFYTGDEFAMFYLTAIGAAPKRHLQQQQLSTDYISECLLRICSVLKDCYDAPDMRPLTQCLCEILIQCHSDDMVTSRNLFQLVVLALPALDRDDLLDMSEVLGVSLPYYLLQHRHWSTTSYNILCLGKAILHLTGDEVARSYGGRSLFELMLARFEPQLRNPDSWDFHLISLIRLVYCNSAPEISLVVLNAVAGRKPYFRDGTTRF